MTTANPRPAVKPRDAKQKALDALLVGKVIAYSESYPVDWDDHTNEYVMGTVRTTETVVRATRHCLTVEYDNRWGEWVRCRRDKTYYLEEVEIEDEATRSLIEQSIPPAKGEPKHKQDAYMVYTLIDPRDQRVHYVGISVDVERRYREHVTCSGLNLQKNLWVLDLMQHHLQPSLTIIETVQGSDAAHERETYWIQHYLQLQAPLTNILEVTQ